MTTPQPTPRPRGSIAQRFLHEGAMRDAERLQDPDERAAAVAQTHADYPLPHTHRRTR